VSAGPFFEQFIDDYYAECDEHLAVVRRALLVLEERRGDEAAERHALERSLHTLKGLSGMVGLTSAERIAHAMEEWLRAEPTAASDGAADPRLVETLFDGARLLERCVGARRAGTEPPDVSAYLVASESATGDGGASAAARDEPTAIAPAAEGTVYRFEFEPSRELAARGVGVETVRERLQSIGTLLAARPRVEIGGGVVFEFVVGVPAGVVPDEGWRSDRLSWSVDADAHAPGVGLATVTPAPRVPAPASHAPIASAPARAASNSVRVDLARLDDIMRLVGELVVSRARLDDSLRHADGDASDESLRETNAAMERQLRALREGVMRIRLVPIGEAFERMRFAVRDVARERGRLVALELAGEMTEIDKLVVDRMLEPLLHLVRNAVSHGIEAPDERRALGKLAEGRLALRAAASGDRIRVEVEDDGAGIAVDRVAERARAMGLIGSHATLDDEMLLDILCAPGFSTRGEADLASGRGIGMAVVRAAIRALGGELSLRTQRGVGTRFTAELPLTLMIVDALLVEIGPHTMAVPQPALREILRVDADTPTRFEANAVIPYRGGVLPLLSLRREFALGDDERDPLYVLVVGSDAHPAGLTVDRVLGLREIVVHPVTDPLVAMPGIGGATELGDGRVCLILDPAALVREAQERRTSRVASRTLRAPAGAADRD
jgi:two-component system chemotaxis sensor kinase CheA